MKSWFAILTLCSCLIPLTASGQTLSSPITPANKDKKWEQITPFTTIDKGHTQRQRQLIDDLARRHLGRQIRGDKYSDLALLQGLLDRGIIDQRDTAKLQAMGVVLGDLLAAELQLSWVIYEDDSGRNRALRYGQLNDVLFPITMISRRAEAGARVDVTAVFEKAVKRYKPLLPPLPYS
jgi:hypothetical protein